MSPRDRPATNCLSRDTASVIFANTKWNNINNTTKQKEKKGKRTKTTKPTTTPTKQ
jgi:hypothetical protein